MGYLKLWNSVLDSPKIQRLRLDLFKLWINVLLATNRRGGPDGELPPISVLDFELRGGAKKRPRTIKPKLVELLRAGLLDEIHSNPIGGELYKIHDWTQWQVPKDKTAAERQRRFRERNALRHAQHNGVTYGENTPETAPKDRNVTRNITATRNEGIKEEERLAILSGISTPSHAQTRTRTRRAKRPTLPADAPRAKTDAEADAERNRQMAALAARKGS